MEAGGGGGGVGEEVNRFADRRIWPSKAHGWRAFAIN